LFDSLLNDQMTTYTDMCGVVTPAKGIPAPVDYGNVPPKNYAECMGIERTLDVTHNACFEWTGHEAPMTDQRQAYDLQWEEIYASFQSSYGTEFEEQWPFLIKLSPSNWNGSVMKWRHVKDSFYYEAQKLGHRAPRDEYGKLVNVPGPLIEKFSESWL